MKNYYLNIQILVISIVFLTSLLATGAQVPCGGQAGTIHANGKGFIATTATVPETVFVSADSEVCGETRIISSGRIEGSKLYGNGIIRNHGTIKNSTLKGYYRILGYKDGFVELDHATIIGPNTLNDNTTSNEWIILSGKVKVDHAKVIGSDIGIHYGSLLLPGSSVIGDHIEILSTTLSGHVGPCQYLNAERRDTHDYCLTQSFVNDPSPGTKD